ncbi:MAG: HD domain-containing phosphohydrolase [Spirochaetia bacterium]
MGNSIDVENKLREIFKLDSELNTIQDMDILLEKILYKAREAVNADAGSIYIKEGDELVFKYSQNDTKEKELPPGQKLIYSIFKVKINKNSISGYAAETGETLNIPDMYSIPEDAPYSFNPKFDRLSGYKTVSTLTIPLLTNLGDTIGVLQLINAKDSNGEIAAFSKDAELFANHFASNATMALQRAKMTRAILLRMISMAELRDPKETGAHVNRVASFAVEIYEEWARRKKVSEDQIDKIKDVLRMAAMLHDVGKVAISDLILKKPARFTDEEYEIMKRHTHLGAKLFVDKQSEFDEIALEVALTHHENWDGTGYPGKIDPETGEVLEAQEDGKARGLKGDEISIYGRIVAVADVFDALSSKRVYKEAWKEEDVLAEVRKLSNTKFDPELVDIFFHVLPSIRQIQERYPNSED